MSEHDGPQSWPSHSKKKSRKIEGVLRIFWKKIAVAAAEADSSITISEMQAALLLPARPSAAAPPTLLRRGRLLRPPRAPTPPAGASAAAC